MNTIFRTLQVNKWLSKKQTLFSFNEINATKFDTKITFHTKIKYHYMISFGFIIVIEVDSCKIWFHLDCIIQLK